MKRATTGLSLAILLCWLAPLALACGTRGAAAPAEQHAPTGVSATPAQTSFASVEGRVLSPAGEPIRGAWIVATDIAQSDERLSEVTQSDRAGQFRFGELAAGRYTIAGTADGFAAAALEPLALEIGKVTSGLELRLGAQGLTLRGAVGDTRGRPVSGASVYAWRVSDTHDGVFYTRTDSSGQYQLTLPPADLYGARAAAPGLESKPRGVDARKSEPAHFTLRAELQVGKPAPAAVVEWVRARAITVSTVEPEQDLADLEPLRALIGDARVVGLGESTHGTHEFFRLKHRLFEFLATEMGFTIFALETNFTEALCANSYVLTGKGDAEECVRALYGVWHQQEWVELLRWMRRYNQTHGTQLEFHGFDMQSTEATAGAVLAYLREVDPPAVREAERSLGPLATPVSTPHYLALSVEKQRGIAAGIARLRGELERRRDDYVRRSGPARWTLARQQLQLLGLAEERLHVSDASARHLRDRDMAEMVSWLLESAGPKAKMVVSAHNYHVGHEEVTSMGHHLEERLGPAFTSLGFIFHGGELTALYQTDDGKQRFDAVPLPAPATESLEAALVQSGHPLFALDLRQVPQQGPVADWFSAWRPAWEVGFSVSDAELRDATQQLARRIVPGDAHDALIFAAQTTAARRLPRQTGASRARSAPPVVQAPTNLGFEDGVESQVPRGWWTPAGASSDYRVELDPALPHRGKASARVTAPDKSGPWDHGLLSQMVDATALRGQRIRLSAAVRVRALDSASHAQLFIDVRGPEEARRFYDDSAAEPIRSRTWQVHSISALIAEDAVSIRYGLTWWGKGEAWLDSVAVERD